VRLPAGVRNNLGNGEMHSGKKAATAQAAGQLDWGAEPAGGVAEPPLVFCVQGS